ncbi:MAG: type 4a pilus biogenesis protein PilO [bacterium]
MDLKDPQIQKILLGVLVIVLLVYFWHSKVFSPNDEALDQRQANYERLMANLKTIELKAKSLSGLRNEYGKLLDRYHVIEKLLPEEDKVPEFLMQLHAASMGTQSLITEVDPSSGGGETFYNVSQYAIEFDGTYHELGSFLASVANFPFITNVSILRMRGLSASEVNQEGSGQIGENDNKTLKANFLLSTYYVKPEERFQGVEL